MSPNLRHRKPVIVTTSWDDGHPLDVRLAELLRSYSLRGSFYVALNFPKGPDIDEKNMRRLREMGMEVGSHTLTHRMLTDLKPDAVLHELRRSREILEGMTEGPVQSISYPEGKFNWQVREAAHQAGYRLGRTTIEFRVGAGFDAYRMPVCLTFRRRSRYGWVRHALRDFNIGGLLNWCLLGLESNPARLAESLFHQALQAGGIFHLCGRARDVHEMGLWNALEEVFRVLAGRDDVLYLTNIQVLDEVSRSLGARLRSGRTDRRVEELPASER